MAEGMWLPGSSTSTLSVTKSASDPNEKDYQGRDTVFRLKFEIPVGPGVSYTNGNNIGGQIIEQTLGNILQGIDFGN